MTREPEALSTGRRRRGAAFVILALLPIAALGPVVGNDFVNYDDDRYVYENSRVRAGLSVAGLRWALATFEQANWHPLTWLSHMADVSLFGLQPAGHHATSLLIHIASALLLLAALEGLTGVLWRSAFVAALFAVHPLHVESVAWVAERKDVLAGFFWMATLAAWTRYLRLPGPGRYLVVLCCYALGLAAKPVLVTLPLVLLLLDFWPLGRWHPGASGAATAAARLVREKAPLLTLALASGVVTMFAQASGGALKTMVEYPFGERLANALLSCVAYLAQTVWPTGLAVFYPHPGADAVSLKAAGAAFLLAGATRYFVRRAAIRPGLAVGWLWYLVTLAPVLGLIQVGAQARADRYTYLPLVGIFLLVAWGVPTLVPATRGRRAALGAIAVIAVSGSLAAARAQVRHWSDSISLFEHALKVTRGNYIAHDNLSGALDAAGRKREGLLHALEALKLEPDRPERHLALARELTREGLGQEAVVVLALAIERAPGFAEAHHALGLALTRLGRLDEARDRFAAAVLLAPASARYRAALEASERRRAEGGR